MLDRILQFTPVAIVQSDTTVLEPHLWGIIVSEEGTLVIENIFGDEVSIVIPAGAALPFTLWARIRKVKADTDQSNANLVGLS